MLDSSMGLLRSNFKEFVGKIPEGNLGVEYLMNPSGSSDRQEIQVESYRGSSLTIFPTPAPILTRSFYFSEIRKRMLPGSLTCNRLIPRR